MNLKTLHCSWCRGKVAPCYESVIYEAVAAATSASTTVEPGKLDVGATEGHELQHIGNQKMPTGPPEDSLSLKSLPTSEEDNDDAQVLPARPEDGLFLRCSPQCKDEDDDDGDVDCDDDDDDDDVQIGAWKGNDLMLESISDVETHSEIGFHHFGQAGLKLLTSRGPPNSVSETAGSTGVSHSTWPHCIF
ncbi:aspartate-rich protein 1-like isoform X11 [Macaca nemestrina]|uniref:aspartate-rich protein 1-like isoform X11 n=1 Tax=Macaca nemestrina TaxID=9545 RepID=UPI0039B84A40